MSDLTYTMATKEDMFIKVWWRFYKFNNERFDTTCLYILDKTPSSLFGIYFI